VPCSQRVWEACARTKIIKFRGSTQHLPEAYWRASRNLESISSVDSGVAQHDRVALANRRTGLFLEGKYCRSSKLVCFVDAALPGTLRIAELDLYIRGYRECLVLHHLQPLSHGSERRRHTGSLRMCPLNGLYDCRVFPGHLDPSGATRMTFHPGARCDSGFASAINLLVALGIGVPRVCHNVVARFPAACEGDL
jgi:hypothetical protein